VNPSTGFSRGIPLFNGVRLNARDTGEHGVH
jgi:hypothetical protein